MRTEPSPWATGVVLVCTNERPEGAAKPSCGRLRGAKLRAWLKDHTHAGDGGRPVRVMATSCLGICPAHGVAVALVPDGDVRVVDPVVDREALLAEVVGWIASRRRAASGVAGRLRRRLLGN